MTNPATPPSGGGMPKWLIIVLVLLLLIILGCCGGFVACRWACAKAVSTVGTVVPAIGNLATQKAQEELMAATQRAAEEAKRQAAQAAGGSKTPAGGAGAGGGGTAGGAGGGNPTPILGGKIPSNFPKDVPIMSGLSSTGISGSDNLKGSGTVQFTGNAKVDDIVAYYEKQMKDGGWTESDNSSFGGMSSLGFTKDKRKVTILVTPNNNTNIVTLVYETTP